MSTAEPPPPRQLRRLLSFALPLLVLAATWRILASNEVTPLELQLLLARSSGSGAQPWGGIGLVDVLARLGFYRVDREIQLLVFLGTYAFGVLLLGASLLSRMRTGTAHLSSLLGIYALFVWLLPLENGALALHGLLVFPLAVLAQPLVRCESHAVGVSTGLVGGVLFLLCGSGAIQSVCLLLATWSTAVRRKGGAGFATLAVPFLVVLVACAFLFPGFAVTFRIPDLWADLRLREGVHGPVLPFLFLTAMFVVPGTFAASPGRRESPVFGILVLALLVGFAVVARSALSALDHRYRADLATLHEAARDLLPGMPWITLNLPRHLRPGLALAVPPVHWPHVTMLVLPDTGTQLHVPERLNPEEWTVTLRYTSKGVERSSWGEVLLVEALPRVVLAADERGFASPRVRMFDLGSLRGAKDGAGVDQLEWRPVATKPGAREWALDIRANRSDALRVALLLEPAAVGSHRGFSPPTRSQPIETPQRWPWAYLSASNLDLSELKSGTARWAGYWEGFGPVLELVPEAGHIEGRVRLRER